MIEPIAIQVKLKTDNFQQALEAVTTALQKQGFGVVAELDLKAKFQDKLSRDFRPYTILGACNPPLAYRALESDPKSGLMLPCNVVVEQDPDGCLVSAANPRVLMGLEQFAGNEVLLQVAEEAYDRLAAALRSLEG